VSLNLFASSNYCTFIGSNTQVALQYTNDLISNLKKLKEETNCSVSDRSFRSLDDITKFYSYYLEHRSLEAEVIQQKEQLEQLYSAYVDTPDPTESTDVLKEMLSIKTDLIENEASLKIADSTSEEDYKKTTIQNLVVEISNVINDAYQYEGCFQKDPARAASIIGGLVNLTGSVAGLAGLNPLWSGIGNIVGSLATSLGQAMRNYQWKYIDELDKTALFYNLVCMVEMQSNYYCEKQTEISLIKELMRLDFTGENTQGKMAWQGFDIQADAIPVFQSWIKRLYYGTPPANTTDAAAYNVMLRQVSSAEAIQNLMVTMFQELKEKIEEGGDKFNLIRSYTTGLHVLMTGYSTNGMSNGSVMESNPGTIYFTQRFNAGLMSYILVAPPEEIATLQFPTCPTGTLDCDLFMVFLQKYYKPDPTSEVNLKRIIDNMEMNIKMIMEVVSRDMDRDLLKRRLGDPGVLLAKAEIKDRVYDLSPRESLIDIHAYLIKVIETLRKYYDYHFSDETCIVENKSILGCPTPLQEVIKTRNILGRVLAILDNNMESAAVRVTQLSDLLQFKDNTSLLLVPKFEIILKKDLEAKIDLGEISPMEDELIHLLRQNVLENLRKEGLDSDKRQAIDDRERAQEIITYNLKSFIEVKPLRNAILDQIKMIKKDFDEGILINLDTYHEACSLLLATPYKSYNSGEGLTIATLCKNSRVFSEWNKIRLELNMEILPELNLSFADSYKKNFPQRVCAYNNHQKKNIVYGLKKKKSQKSGMKLFKKTL